MRISKAFHLKDDNISEENKEKDSLVLQLKEYTEKSNEILFPAVCNMNINWNNLRTNRETRIENLENKNEKKNKCIDTSSEKGNYTWLKHG